MKTSVIVIGLGAMGSAAAQHLATRGCHVLGFDRFRPPHTLGSSHGQSRITRQSYWEDSRYVPLLLRAYDLWRKLEADTGQSLLHLTGGLMIGPTSGDLVARSAHSATSFNLSHELLSAAQLQQRFPAFTVDEAISALWEQKAGYLLPEACVQQQLNQASKAGADLHYDEPAISWQATPGGAVSVQTARGTYHADHLVITAGPWAPQILESMQLPLQVTRQVLYWFEPASHGELFQPDRFPVFLLQSEGDPIVLYGFPSIPTGLPGVKVALHGSADVCTPESVLRELRPQDELAIRTRLNRMIPLLGGGRLLHAETCLYTMTPDEHFLIDQHPEFSQVTIAAGLSGHGFKFASVMGEILADLATGNTPPYDLDLFSINRFTPQEPHS